MKKSIGFLVPVLNNDIHTQNILNCVSDIIVNKPYSDAIIFNIDNNADITTYGYFSIMHINEAKLFTGPMICFDLSSMKIMKHCISSQKIFVDKDLEWQTYVNLDKISTDMDGMYFASYENLYDLYVSSNDLLVTDKQENKEIIEVCWKDCLYSGENYGELLKNIKI